MAFLANMNSVRLSGNFPIADEDTPYTLPHSDATKVKSAITRLWMTGNVPASVVLLYGESGVGKSALMSHIMHDNRFLATLPGLEVVFWLHICKFIGPFNEDSFITELVALLRNAGIQDLISTSMDCLKTCLGANKRYLLVIDNAYNMEIASLVAQLNKTIRTILIYRNRTEMGDPPMEDNNFVPIQINLEPSDDFALRCWNLPPEIRKDKWKYGNVREMLRGLPLISRIVSTHFKGLVGQKEATHRYLELTMKYAAQNRPANLLKLALSHLKKKDRLRYYTFLILDPCHPITPKILTWFWRIPSEVHVKKICRRFVDFGLAYEVVDKEKEARSYADKEKDTRSFAINAYLHQAAEQLAIDYGIGEHLFQVREWLVEEKSIPRWAVLIASKVRKILRSKGPTNLNFLQFAVGLEDWNLVQSIYESCEDVTLLNLCCETDERYMSALRKLYGTSARSRRAQQLFLAICEKMKHQSTGIRRKEVEIIRFLVGRHLSLGERIKGGDTALMVAAKEGHAEVVRFLLEEGAADTNERDDEGATALLRAAKFGHLQIVKLLRNHGVDLSQRDKDGKTALIWASKFGHLDVVRFLHNEAVNLDERDTHGLTALMWAARFGHLAIVQYMHGNQMDLTKTSCDGETALALANGKSPFYGGFRDEERQEVAAYLRQHTPAY